MQPDPQIPPSTTHSQAGGGAPPALAAVPPPILPPGSDAESSAARSWLALLLSACLGLFLADAIVSLADDSLGLFFGFHGLAGVRMLVGLLAGAVALLVYVMMAFTPKIPRRLFVPLCLFNLLTLLVALPFAIFFYERSQLIEWIISVAQVVFGVWVLYRLGNGFKFRWPLVPPALLNHGRFSWWNFCMFVLVNFCGLLPAVVIYLFFCAALAVDHFTSGFMALHPGGFTVQVRTYARNDGKTIQLYPMAHVAEADFYRQISQSFPTNSIILMEGVTDSQNLLTNKISYERMAKSLGLAEQHAGFAPTRGTVVPADVDVDQFSKGTLNLLNLVMLIHSQGVNPKNIQALLQYQPSPQMEEELMDDLLRNRNQHLLGEIKVHLPLSDTIIVPWGVAHMPGISTEIQKSGFLLTQSRNYEVIRFHFFGVK